ncbi:tetratricopeptide repeat protein [Thermogutta sp.]|uniref:tetratricopeptide repeat protein n=1 Tax=Thermogutta sp. TaxID=1962930 RepID=UPI003C7AF35F
MMRRSFPKIVMLLVISSTLMSSRTFCAADQQASSAVDSPRNAAYSPPQTPQFDHVVLLLRNGHVIEGQLITIDDNYHVKVPHGEIYISRRDVVAVAASMRELYYQQRSRLFGEDPEPHLELAIWCAEHGLPDEARAELAEARRLAPEHPGLPLATRRVEMAFVREGERNSAASRPPGDGSRAGQTSQSPASVLNTGKKATSPHTMVSPVPDLAVLLRGLPEDAREDFVRVIQPILSHNCAAAACHGGTAVAPELRLFRLSPDRYALRGQTAQNLRTVLGWIDFDQPGASPILTKPLQPHGGMPGPVFSGTDMKQYRDLVDWVYRVTQQRTPPPPEEVRPTGTPPGTAVTGEAAAGINLDDVLPLREDEVQPATFVQDLHSATNPVVSAGAAIPGDSGHPRHPGENPAPPSGSSPSFWRIPVGQFLRQVDSPWADVRFTFGDFAGNGSQQKNASSRGAH